ncbi:MAG: NUDIX domain-containing protein [Bacteroidetes bacterium]|nr:MAG: NUDIX domain-containing protein [Bacteroidota bacterium]
MSDIQRFNIRVYGLLVYEGKVLLSDEEMGNYAFTKFPGGGLEYGEGIADGLKREFQEELEAEIELTELFYINEFFQQSAFKKSDQLVSIYYRVSSLAMAELLEYIEGGWHPVGLEHRIRFHWQEISSLNEEQLTFPIDKLVAQKLKTAFETRPSL